MTSSNDYGGCAYQLSVLLNISGEDTSYNTSMVPVERASLILGEGHLPPLPEYHPSLLGT